MLGKIGNIFDNNGTVHMCETSAKYVISHLYMWTGKPKVLGIVEAYFRGDQDGSTINVSQNWKYVGSTVVSHLCCTTTGSRSEKMCPTSETVNMLKGFVQ